MFNSQFTNERFTMALEKFLGLMKVIYQQARAIATLFSAQVIFALFSAPVIFALISALSLCGGQNRVGGEERLAKPVWPALKLLIT